MRNSLLKPRGRFEASLRRLLTGTALGLLPLLAVAQAASPSGAYLLRKAEILQAAGQYDAATTAYNQATGAFHRAADSDGQQRALTQLAAMEEKRADDLLAGLAAPAPAAPVLTASATPRPATPKRAVAAAPAPAAAPLAGKVLGRRPVGLFFMSRYIIAFHSLEKATYYFTPAGQAYYNPVDFAPASLASLPANARGSYSVAGGQLVIKWADGKASKANFENPSSNAFTWDMGIFVGMGPFANARQLVGSFEGGNSVSSGSGSAAAVSGLTFRADGTYSGSSVSSFTTNTSETNAHVGGSGEAAGHWALSGWTLTLTDAAGRSSRGVAYPIETDEKTGVVRRFYFNSVAYKRL